VVPAKLRVIYGDTDQMGVVYYANYLRFFEAGRNEFIRAKGLRYRDFEEAFGLRLPVAEASVSYKLPARYDDLLDVEVSLAEVRRASARFEYRLVREGVLLATGHCTPRRPGRQPSACPRCCGAAGGANGQRRTPPRRAPAGTWPQ
jgi:acyl-CoA thioester hydrolase